MLHLSITFENGVRNARNPGSDVASMFCLVIQKQICFHVYRKQFNCDIISTMYKANMLTKWRNLAELVLNVDILKEY